MHLFTAIRNKRNDFYESQKQQIRARAVTMETRVKDKEDTAASSHYSVLGGARNMDDDVVEGH